MKYLKHIIGFIVITTVLYVFGVLCTWSFNPGSWNTYGRIILAVAWIWKILDYVELVQDYLYHKEYETKDEE